MRDKVIVSVASMGRENYLKAQLNLIKSAHKLQLRDEYDFMFRAVDGYIDQYLGVFLTQGWPHTELYGTSWQHADMPYQFKPFAVWEAYERGYTKILWCDSTIRIMKRPNWELAKQHGICAWDNEGHPLKNYITDYAVEKTGLKDMNAKQIMACCIMFDFNHPKTKQVVQDWIDGSLNNAFHKSTENGQPSRHDQSYLSALMSVHGIEVQPYGELAYPHYTPIKPTYLNWGCHD